MPPKALIIIMLTAAITSGPTNTSMADTDS